MCSWSYVIQAEAIAAKALTEMTLAPYAENQGEIAPPDVALATFDAWLDEKPKELTKPWAEVELEELLFAKRG